MAAGMGMLHLAPDEFWATTPAELDAALAGTTGRLQEQYAYGGFPARRDLLNLMDQFPD